MLKEVRTRSRCWIIPAIILFGAATTQNLFAQNSSSSSAMQMSELEPVAAPTFDPASPASVQPKPTSEPKYSTDELKKLYAPLQLKGSAIAYPATEDTILGLRNPERLWLAEHGFYVSAVNGVQFIDNLYDPPVPLASQTYLGQRPTWVLNVSPLYMTWDMQALHIRGGQLQVFAYIQRTSWFSGNPESTRINRLAYYQSLMHGHVELKGGIIGNDNEFFGMQVGNVVTASAIGSYAKIPFVVGVAHSPYGTPGLNTKIELPDHIYTKVGFQRSTDYRGQVEELKRDDIGLRLFPHGDGLITIGEAGYRKAASATDNYTWLRGGAIYNTTHYTNFKTGGMTTNDNALYLLGDRQFIKTDMSHPARGWYGGFTTMYAPPAQNTYSQSYELRAYNIGLFQGRPKDLFTVVVDRIDYSKYKTESLLQSGKTAWGALTAISPGYSFHLTRGLNFAPGVSWTRGAAVTPRVPDSFTAGASVYYTF